MFILWNELRERLGLKPLNGRRIFTFEESIITELLEQAKMYQMPAEELASDILIVGLAQRKGNSMLKDRWKSLSAREKDVAAFSCLGYTNQQIAPGQDISFDLSTEYRTALSLFDKKTNGEK
jgi:FixJ family two-component response regulator